MFSFSNIQCLLLSVYFSVAQIDPKLQNIVESIFGNGCKCVPYYLCEDGDINTDGSGLIDERIKNNQICENVLEICCNLPVKESTPDIVSSTTPLPQRRKCGRRNPNGVGYRISHGDEESEYGEFPWIVAIYGKNKYLCHGSLIHPKVVLTAAHCVKNKNESLKIHAGDWDWTTQDELFPHQIRYVSSVLINPDFYEGALYNDIAILILEKPIVVMETVDIVCLPPQDFLVHPSKCLVSGWGKNSFGSSGKHSSIMKKVEIQTVDANTCAKKLKYSRLGRDFCFHESYLCAVGDSCSGDGGGPLMCPIPGESERYYQTGIVSWGIGCGSGTPGVYTNVAIFRNWIDEIFTKNHLEKSYSFY